MKQKMSKEAYEVLVIKMARGAGVVKLACGVGNNAAWGVAQDAFDHAKQCKRYDRHIQHVFGRAFHEWAAYEHRLIYATTNCMFRVKDMPPEIRRRYKADITDEEYYRFWAAKGYAAYGKTRPLITSLWNKYRLTLISHKVDDAEHVAWVMTAMACLNIAESMYTQALESIINGYQIMRDMAESTYGQFSIHRVCQAWRRAMLTLSPECDFKIEGIEDKNIAIGIEQLTEAWSDPTIMYTSIQDSADDYEDVFATQGFKKKALKEVERVKEATKKELQKTER